MGVFKVVEIWSELRARTVKQEIGPFLEALESLQHSLDGLQGRKSYVRISTVEGGTAIEKVEAALDTLEDWLGKMGGRPGHRYATALALALREAILSMWLAMDGYERDTTERTMQALAEVLAEEMREVYADRAKNAG